MDALKMIRDVQKSSIESNKSGAVTLDNRDLLLADIYAINTADLLENAAFLVVINIADTNEYDEIIRIFGYKFADDMLGIRLETIAKSAPGRKFYHVGYWSIGFIFSPTDVETCDTLLNRLVLSLSKPIICRGIPIPIKPGIGVCDIKKGIGSANDLLQSTFLAGRARSGSDAGWRECNYDLADDHRRAFSIIADFEYSLSQANEFEIYFQPRLDLRTNRYSGAEALLRWRHPHLGSITPNEFIPLVEKTGLIRELTRWVLTNAIAAIAHLHKKGYQIQVSVNVSIRNLEESDFFPFILESLNQYGLEPNTLEIELSENSIFSDLGKTSGQLAELRNAGITVAMDDFGTGHNSFGVVRDLPLNMLKIDGPLIASMGNNSKSQSIVKAIIGLGHETGMSIVGKGVESKDELDMLKNWSCDYAQGYFLGAPKNIADFTAWCGKNYH